MIGNIPDVTEVKEPSEIQTAVVIRAAAMA